MRSSIPQSFETSLQRVDSAMSGVISSVSCTTPVNPLSITEDEKLLETSSNIGSKRRHRKVGVQASELKSLTLRRDRLRSFFQVDSAQMSVITDVSRVYQSR